MVFWVDGDSCPRQVRDLLGRHGLRLQIPVYFVANRPLKWTNGHPVILIEVSKDPGAADRVILDEAKPGDLVVTRDIPLAAQLVERGILTLNDRGDIFTADYVRERLSLRNFSLELRTLGVTQAGGKNYGQKEYQTFAQALDRELLKLQKMDK